MNSSTSARMFPQIQKAFLGAVESDAIGRLDCSGLFLMNSLHMFSVGQCSGPTVHNGSYWNTACHGSEVLTPTLSKLFGLWKVGRISAGPCGVLVVQSPQKGRDDNVPTGVRSPLPLKHQERKWNWLENPASAQPGTEGIIVLIVLILCPTPPSSSNSTHQSPPPPFLLLCGSLGEEPPFLGRPHARSVDRSNLWSSSQLKL